MAAVESGYSRIGLVDGAIDEHERLPAAELKEALAVPGVTIMGAASTGAVRATELERQGMRGVGRVFRLFRRGYLRDTDEVYVLHAPAALHYRCLTMPLVNIRCTLRAMRIARFLSRAEEDSAIGYMREVPWFDRDRHALAAMIHAACGSARCARAMQAFESMYRDVKREDAMSLLAALRQCRAASIT
jgi:hypothetical protein